MTGAKYAYFDASLLPEKQRYAAFQESMSVIYDISEPELAAAGFRGKIASHLLGDIMVVEVEANEQNFSRSRRKIANDLTDHYMVQAYRRGYTQRIDGDAACRGSTENVIIYDAAEPWESRTSDFCNITLAVPRRVLADKLLAEGGHHGRLIGPENPLGPVLQEYLLRLPEIAHHISSQEIERIVQPCIDLVAAALNHCTALHNPQQECSEAAEEAWVSSLQTRIKRYIDRHIAKPDLGVEQLLAEFGISRAHLYRIFPIEKGIATYIRERRLDLAYRKLCQPASRVSQVAFELGFKSESTFRRVFKERFAVAPSELVRQTAFELSAQELRPAFEVEGRVWEQWLHRL